MKVKEAKNIFLRYILILLVAFPRLELFYFLFTPLTVYPTYFLLNIFFETFLEGNVIHVLFSNKAFPVEIVDSCVAGAAYYFLFVLNMAIPSIKVKKRVRMIAFAFASLLLINIIRIFFLSLMFIYENPYFDVTHYFFWYILSIFFVVAIWFFEVRLFKVKQIPFYTDFKNFYKISTLKKSNRKKSKKSKSSKKN